MSEPHQRMLAEQVFAWIGQDGDGCEGILMFRSSGGGMLPMVSNKESLVDAMRPMAEQLHHSGEFVAIRKVVYERAAVLDRL